MTEMHQFVCWHDEAVLAATPRDAASLDPSHFQAVHHPLKLRRRALGARGAGRWVEEREIVQVLGGALRPDGYLLVPVVGGSGTGKSHLVRWVYEHTRERNGWESRYLAKNRTSIRRAIEIVIEGLEGPAIENAREALTAAPAQNESEDTLGQRLLDELALITAEESMQDVEAVDRRSAQMVAKLRRELPDILRDPVVRRRLTREGAVIPRLVGLALRGRRDGDGLDDDAIRVVENDLPLAFEEIGTASEGARKLLTQLATHGELKSTAVGLINDALPAAVKRVFVSSKVDLIEVFREVRRSLLTEGKELVLFIEDLTVLHGVEREFLDAIVEPAKSPDGNLCPLRVLFAVTEGHFDGLDTVRTRCDDAYWLDASYGEGGVNESEARSFLGRYLNASRLQPAMLQDRWATRSGSSWLPNACDDCRHQLQCHETFGKSDEGYGLYPFNEPAVDRFVKAVSAERFDPREVVRELVNRFLVIAAADVPRGEFPSDELVAPFNDRSDPLDPVVESEVRARRSADAPRTVNALRYWSASSSTVSDEVLAAFGIASLDGLNIVQTARPSTRSRSQPGRRTSTTPDATDQPAHEDISSRLRAPWPSIVEELTQWAGNQRDLSARATNELKKLIHKTVVQNLDGNALPVSLGADFDEQKRFDRERHIHLEGSVTDQSRGDTLLEIRRDAETATALQGLVLLQELPDECDYPRADNYRWQAARHLERWVQSVTASLEQAPAAVAVQAVEGLLISAMIHGAFEHATRPHDYLAALFESQPAKAGPSRSEDWKQLVDRADATYQRLRPVVEAHFAEARGVGGPRAIRADQLLSIIQDFTSRWPLESKDAAIDRFMRSVRPAVQREWSSLCDVTQRAAKMIDLGKPWTDQVARITDLVDAAHQAGRLPDYTAARELGALAAALDDNTHRIVGRAEQLTQSEATLDHQLRAVASDLPDIMNLVGRFVDRAEQALDAIALDLGERPPGEVGEDDDLEKVATDVLHIVNGLSDAVEALAT